MFAKHSLSNNWTFFFSSPLPNTYNMSDCVKGNWTRFLKQFSLSSERLPQFGLIVELLVFIATMRSGWNNTPNIWTKEIKKEKEKNEWESTARWTDNLPYGGGLDVWEVGELTCVLWLRKGPMSQDGRGQDGKLEM